MRVAPKPGCRCSSVRLDHFSTVTMDRYGHLLRSLDEAPDRHRSQPDEPVFAQIKEGRGVRCFMRRGLVA